jgi:hypothetical protein
LGKRKDTRCDAYPFPNLCLVNTEAFHHIRLYDDERKLDARVDDLRGKERRMSERQAQQIDILLCDVSETRVEKKESDSSETVYLGETSTGHESNYRQGRPKRTRGDVFCH